MTVTLAVAVLKAVVPPAALASAVVRPEVPPVWSQALTCKAADTPFQSASGTKRTRARPSAGSRRALAAVGAPMADHVLPPSRLASQRPPVVPAPTTAMPESAPASGSVTCPDRSAETARPGLAAASSCRAGMACTPASTGAVLGAAVTVIDSVAEEPVCVV